MKTKIMTAKKADTIVERLPPKVQKALDSDYASHEKAERALGELEGALRQHECTPQFALARAFQIGVVFANELRDRIIREAERSTVR